MKRGMTFEYLKYRADLNFEVDFGVNGTIGAIVTKWDLIVLNGKMSTGLAISAGVPQGSVLGSLLFLIYINNLPLVSNIFTMLMYADDTTLYCNVNPNVKIFWIVNYQKYAIGLVPINLH